MKKKLTLLTGSLALIITLLSLPAKAQDARMGIKAGVNVSNLYAEEVNDENARIGFNGGLYGQVLSTPLFALQPELLFSTKGSENEYDGLIDQTVKFNLNYLELPVLAVFKLGNSAEIHAGAYGSYLMNANISYSGDLGNDVEDLDRDHFNPIDYGLVGGFGLNFGNLQVGTRYNLGLQRIADSDTARDILGDSKNSVAQLYLSLNIQ